MIETAPGLAAVESIAATPGLDGLYVGPSDLGLALGAAFPGDPSIEQEFGAALRRIVAACDANGIVAGVYCPSGAIAAERFAAGFSFVTVANDLSHLEAAAAAHLATARNDQDGGGRAG